MSSVESTWDAFNAICTKCRKQQEYIEMLEKNYEREKTAIDAKVNSNTQMKNTFIRNTKVENKITSCSSTKEEKLKYFDDTIKEQYDKLSTKSKNVRDVYENKMEREIEALENKIKEVKLKYEMRIQIEITDLNQKAEAYISHLTRQRKMIEDKTDTIIRDLSANIIVHNIGDVFDEDAFPRLTKLKFDIQTEKEKLTKLEEEKKQADKAYQEADARKKRMNREEQAERDREEQRKQLEKDDMLRRQRKADRDAEAERDRIRQDEKRKEELAKQAKQTEVGSWKEKVYNKLPTEYKKFYHLLDISAKDQITEMNLEDVVEHLDTMKPKLINLQRLQDLYNNNDSYFKEEIWDMYIALSMTQRLEIAQKSKINQLILIKKYYSEIPKPYSDDDEE